jgi:phospholipid/cholesterol/gamma-HCH transport system substrate-binding protein
MSSADRSLATRVAVVAALALALLAIGWTLLRGGSDYTIHAHFLDAGQLVNGSEVQVGGTPIGTVKDLVLTADNQADVILDIDEGEFAPLHEGTTATIRTVSLSGVANRFVELDPGPESAPEIPDGAVLPSSKTRGIVDLDQVLDAFDPETREQLRSFIRGASGLFAGHTREANLAFGYIDPAFAQAGALNREVVRDVAAFERLVRSGGTVSRALASRSTDLSEGIGNAAATLRAIAAERDAVGGILERTPPVLTQARGTLRTLRGTLSVLRPAIREAQPAADPLARVIDRLGPTALAATPVVADVRELLPPLGRALAAMPRLSRSALPALRSSTAAIGESQPIFAGLRPYTPDFVSGLFSAAGAGTGGYYDANGHFFRTKLTIPDATGALAGLLGGFEFPGVRRIRKGLDARCPGGAVSPAADSSNPWVSDPTICNPAHVYGP